jgi:ubiquinone/menaquinone biosynthesis C-methylase UbiE
MAAPAPPRFTDGGGYERMMGRWSRLAGEEFLDWLAPAPALRLLDAGCGNGAFTELLFERAAAREATGIDPSDGLLSTARQRLEGRPADFVQGDAHALPSADDGFDASAMALVINFLDEPPKAVAELVRVTRPGGPVSTDIWDIEGGGFTMEPLRDALKDFGVSAPVTGPEKARLDYLEQVWRSAGLEDVETHRIAITLTYDDFDDFWTANTGIPNSVANAIGRLAPSEVEELKAKLRSTLPRESSGRIAYGAAANAVKGHVPR